MDHASVTSDVGPIVVDPESVLAEESILTSQGLIVEDDSPRSSPC